MGKFQSGEDLVSDYQRITCITASSAARVTWETVVQYRLNSLLLRDFTGTFLY